MYRVKKNNKNKNKKTKTKQVVLLTRASDENHCTPSNNQCIEQMNFSSSRTNNNNYKSTTWAK